MNLFGKAKQAQALPPKPQVSAVDAATMLQNKIELLEKKKDNIDAKIRAKANIAREKNLRGDKTGALAELNFIREYKKQQKTCTNQMLMLERQKINLDGAHTNSIVFEAIDIGNKAMKNLSKNMDEDKKNEILDEYEEILAQNDEINDRMNDLAGGDLTEDEELMAELNAMMESELEQPSSNQQPTSVFNLPQVPVSQVNQIPAKPIRVAHSNADEEALRALALDMS